MSVYHQAEDLINIGAYRQGSNARIDHALERIEGIQQFLKQEREESASFEAIVKELLELMKP